MKAVSFLSVLFALILLSSSAFALQLGEPVQLTNDGQFASPVWRPDGQGLAFAGPKFGSLHYTDLQGNAMPISNSPLSGWKFTWSPDGRNLAYRVQLENAMAMALMVAGSEGEPKQVTPYMNELFPPTWDEDGLTYRSGDELITIDAEGNILKVHSLSKGKGLLSRIASISGSFVLSRVNGATFTAFGSLLSAQAAGEDAGKGLFVDPDNQVWTVDENGERKKLIDEEDEHGYFDPLESPTGDETAVCGMSGNLYVAGRDGKAVNLGQGQNATWSPDGKYLIFERTTDDGHQITSSSLWLASPDGATIYELAGTDGALNPSWSPDGRFVAYIINGQIFLAPID